MNFIIISHRQFKYKIMGNLSVCCDAQKQLQNIQAFTPRLSNPKEQIKIRFPIPTPEINELVSKVSSHPFFLQSDNQKQEGEKAIFYIGEEKIIYEGEVKEERADGKGRVNFPNGFYFTGTFRGGSPTNGIFIFSPNCYYVGGIDNFQACGKGFYENFENGYKYEGQWKKNLPHGSGIQTYNSNEKYEGSFMFGSKFGNGLYKWGDGKVYEGQFYNNLSDGEGKLFLPNGDRYQGQWRLGSMHGRGVYYWKNGQRYEGQYKDGKKHGSGKYYYEDNSIYEGQWCDGTQEGEGRVLEGFDEVKGRWKKGKRLQ